jgi:hypothetical protein
MNSVANDRNEAVHRFLIVHDLRVELKNKRRVQSGRLSRGYGFFIRTVRPPVDRPSLHDAPECNKRQVPRQQAQNQLPREQVDRVWAMQE